MKKNFSKALAGTLTVAMVLGMAAPAAATTAQAYAKNGIKTKYSAIYAGKSKTYTLKTAKKNTKWSVTGEGKQYVTLSAKKGKTVKATIAKDAPAGVKATVVAKLANKKGKFKKVDADKFTIKVDATAVAVEGNGEVKTGSTATYTAKTTPAKTTNHVYFTVTDKNGNATTGATMNATSGVLTANAAGEYKVNVATARGDKKAAEGKFTANASMDVKVTDPAIPDAKLTSAKQTEAKKIVVTFDSEVKEAKNEDFTITCDLDKSTKTLKSVTIGEDKKSATIEVLVDVLDGRDYTISYKGSTAAFKASDNVVADFSINTTEFQIKKPMEMKINVLDKNQVIIKVIDVKNTSVIDGNFSVNVTSNDGYFKDDKLVMQTIGKTEEVTASYFNGKYNGTTGEKEGLIEKKFTITAVASQNLASKYEYATISDAAPDEWSETKCNLQLPINEPTFKNLYAKILDVKGVKTIDGVVNSTDLNISCTSSDDTILLVESSDDNVVLTGVKAGTAYVQVRQNNQTMLTIPVTVTATRTLTNAVLDGANATISNSTRINDDKEVKLDTHKDQYGREYNKYVLDNVELKSWPTQKAKDDTIPGKIWGEKQMYDYITNTDGESKGFVFRAYVTEGAIAKYGMEQAPVGTYKYEVTFKDVDTDKKVMRVQTITVKKPDFSKTPTVKIDMASDYDVAMKKTGDIKNEIKSAKLALFYDGIKGAYVSVPEDRTYITLTKNGSTEKDKITSGAIEEAGQATIAKVGVNKNGTKGGNITVSAIQFAVKFQQFDGTIKYVNKLGTGNYAFKIDLKNSEACDDIQKTAQSYTSTRLKTVTDSKKVDLTKTITIKDTQPKLVVSQVKNNVDAASAHEAIEKTCTFKYDGRTRYKADDTDSYVGMEFVCDLTKQDNTKDNQYYLNGKVYNIVKILSYLDMPNDDDKVVGRDDGYRVKFENKPGFSITVND